MKPLNHIVRKMMSIGVGMLRSKEQHQQLSMQVEAMQGSEEFSDWMVNDEAPEKLLNKVVSLVQKKADDYIYITGKVAGQKVGLHTVLSIQILRACWMVRKSKGNVTWLDEKYIYDAAGQPEYKLAS